MDTNTVELIEKFGSKAETYLNTLAEKAGVATDHFWPIFVKQQVIEGYTSLGVFILVAAVCAGLLAFGLFLYKKDEDSEAFLPPTVIGIIFSLALFFAAMIRFKDAVGKICNPEYYAVKEVIYMIK